MSRYHYAIVDDAKGTIFCKQESVPVVGPIEENYSPYYPAPHDYMEDFSIRSINDDIELYIGDMRIITLKLDELQTILQHIHVVS